uniref:CBS domain-containing protein n=1 Tax=Thermosporothrix sp. COM3 TaxID=2490863 RepID=A0A455SFC9_9CHLR|nr:hypothetical protein KTC_19180 [Thermosporothrix sp. COM3]
MLVRDIMSTQLITISSDETVEQAETVFRAYNLHQIPALQKEDQTFLGVLTREALIQGKLQYLHTSSSQLLEHPLKERKVSDLIQKSPVTVTPATLLEEAISLLFEYKVSYLPVLEGSHLVGLVTWSDLLLAQLHLHNNNEQEKVTPQKKRVAIVGAGLTGLQAAESLASRGYSVLLLEKMPFAGGRMALDPLHQEQIHLYLQQLFKQLDALRVECRYQADLKGEEALSQLLTRFDAVLLTIGRQQSTAFGLSGETVLYDVYPALAFLEMCKQRPDTTCSGSVVVIGSTPTAFYAAQAALRQGASSVTVLYPEATCTLPSVLIEPALTAGLHLKERLLVKNLIGTEEATVQGVHCVSVDFRKKSIPGSAIVIPADTVLIGAGEVPDLSCLPLLLESWIADEDNQQTAKMTFETCIPRVFVAGSMLHAVSTPAQSIQQGIDVARVIHTYLSS